LRLVAASFQTDWPAPAGALVSFEDAFDPANQPKTETVRWITDGAAPAPVGRRHVRAQC